MSTGTVDVNNANDMLSLFFSGGFAFVYEAQDMSSGKDYALKVTKSWISTCYSHSILHIKIQIDSVVSSLEVLIWMQCLPHGPFINKTCVFGMSHKNVLCLLKPMICLFVSEAAVQRRGEEQGNYTGSLFHGILCHFQATMKRHFFTDMFQRLVKLYPTIY